MGLRRRAEGRRALYVQTLVIPGIGHWLAEQAPDELVLALTAFFAPYRDGWSARPGAGALASA